MERHRDIEKVVVLGHSMADVDRIYMEEIDQALFPREWLISQHNGSPTKQAMSVYSFFDRISFFDMESLRISNRR